MRYIKSIYELIGISKEQLETIIPNLIPEHQVFIKERFDNDYRRIESIPWTDKDRLYFYHNIRGRLNKVKDRNQNLGRYWCMDILTSANITKEEFWLNLYRMPKDIQLFAITHFDNNLNMFNNYDEWPEEEQRYYKFTFKRFINAMFSKNPTPKFMPLPEKFGLSLEEFQEIFNALSPKAKENIRKYYSIDFKPNLAINWDPNEKHYLYNWIYRKIRNLIEEGIISKRYHKTYSNLLEKYNITLEQMNYIYRNSRANYKNFFDKVFDKNYQIKTDVVLSKDELIFLHTKISQRIKREIQINGFDLINEMNKSEIQKNNINDAIDATMNPLNNTILSEGSAVNVELKQIYLTKSYYQTYFNYLENLKQEKITLNRKKN